LYHLLFLSSGYLSLYAGSTVSVAFNDKTIDPMGAVTDPVLKFKDFNDDGATTTDWTIPSDTPVGTYYLKAISNLGLQSYSQLIEVVAPGTPERKHRVVI